MVGSSSQLNKMNERRVEIIIKKIYNMFTDMCNFFLWLCKRKEDNESHVSRRLSNYTLLLYFSCPFSSIFVSYRAKNTTFVFRRSCIFGSKCALKLHYMHPAFLFFLVLDKLYLNHTALFYVCIPHPWKQHSYECAYDELFKGKQCL